MNRRVYNTFDPITMLTPSRRRSSPPPNDETSEIPFKISSSAFLKSPDPYSAAATAFFNFDRKESLISAESRSRPPSGSRAASPALSIIHAETATTTNSICRSTDHRDLKRLALVPPSLHISFDSSEPNSHASPNKLMAIQSGIHLSKSSDNLPFRCNEMNYTARRSSPANSTSGRPYQ